MRTATRFPALALLAASVLALPSPVRAGITVPVAQSLPSRVLVVGTDAVGTPDPLGRFQIVVRSLGGDPWINGLVVVDFEDATDFDLCVTQPNLQQYTSCSWGPATGALTDVNSTATLTVLGRANHAAAGSSTPKLRIYCDGILIGTVRVAALDHDGGGLGPSDISLWLDDYFAGDNPERSDLDGDGAVGPADLSFMLAAYFAAGSSQNGAFCP